MYMYQAAPLLHPDAPHWPDMEYLLSRQDQETRNRLFLGSTPKSFQETMKNQFLSTGCSAGAFSSDGAAQQPALQKKREEKVGYRAARLP